MQARQRRFHLVTRHASRVRVCIVGLVLGCAGRDQVALSANQREVANLQRDMFPLFVLGDVNEDLRIDTVDARLIGRLIDSQGKDSTAISCIAAADVSRDGTVDERDRTALGILLDDVSRLAGLPLYSQPYVVSSHE